MSEVAEPVERDGLELDSNLLGAALHLAVSRSVRTGERRKQIVEGAIFFNNDHDVMDILCYAHRAEGGGMARRAGIAPVVAGTIPIAAGGCVLAQSASARAIAKEQKAGRDRPMVLVKVKLRLPRR